MTALPTPEPRFSLRISRRMRNQFREKLDSGLKMLAENQAKGLPNGPAASARPVADGTAEPVADAESQLVAQEADAAKLEAQVRPGGGANQADTSEQSAYRRFST